MNQMSTALSACLTKLENKAIREIDLQFSRFLASLDEQTENIDLLGFLLSYELGQGNVCLDFSKEHSLLNKQNFKNLLMAITSSPLVCCLEGSAVNLLTDQTDRPLVLQDKRLYLQRYWSYECNLHFSIKEKMQDMPWDVTKQIPFIKTLFSSNNKNEVDWQTMAAIIAASGQFSIISGGPGTGKTTTVIRLLALLVTLYKDHYSRVPIIKLAAPTGKAAMRLTESINGAKEALNVTDVIKNHIPDQASTLHRLLQRNAKGDFKYNKFNPLHLDVLIVDEASMVDLPLMSKLLEAMPRHGQLILLGDKDQLASVEAGSVLADMCDSEMSHGFSQSRLNMLQQISGQTLGKSELEAQGADLRNHLCQLRVSYRFHEDSGIGHLSRAANEGNYQAWLTVKNKQYEDLSLFDFNDTALMDFIKNAAQLYTSYLDLLTPTDTSDSLVLDIHEQFNDFQVLCALRSGLQGVVEVNEMIEQNLQNLGKIQPQGLWYAGRPIMVMENDYGLNLYNGDIAIILPKLEEGKMRLKAAFIGTDRKVRWVQCSRLPKHETVFAMTVHKSQGSEFKHCALMLPDYISPVLSKELIYTGITRAKKHLSLIASPHIIKQGLSQKVQRASGLRDRLWQVEKNEAPNEAPNKTPNKTINRTPEKSPNKSPSDGNGPQISLF